MSKFMIIAYDAKEQPELSAEEFQQVMQRYIDWSVGLRKRAKVITADKLVENSGRVLRAEGAQVIITDGPYLESKEVLGGFWMIEVASYEEAVKIAEDHPHLSLGGTLEIREVDPT